MSIQCLEKDIKDVERRIASKNLAVEPILKRLIEVAPPQPLHDRSIYRKYLDLLNLCLEIAEEDQYPEKLLKAVRDYAKMISLVIGDYENKVFKVPKATQADVLKFLMEQHHLTQDDLREELGGQPAVSNILTGKRKLNARQIERLSTRFGLSPATFFTELPPFGERNISH